MAPTTTLSRNRIENAIEALMALLDEIDGNPDLEDNGDYEPSLGSDFLLLGKYEDCELDNSDYEPDHDNEPDHDAEMCMPEWDGTELDYTKSQYHGLQS